MSLSRGPLRIVLLRSGVYDYAELELHQPLHLVAANNVGKTSLISALQFLYIDDARQMHFSHDLAETRRHYFPESGSVVLFECMTPTGFQVYGLRGLGPVQGFEYERFAYNGAYRRDDYLDGRQPRAWDEVVRRLIDRDLRQLEPKHLRASLTGTGDAKGLPLGLVPLKRSGSYDSFRFLFRNLLRLSKIEQDQLKRLFIDITRPNLRKTEVDLRKDYADLFNKVDRQAQEVAALRAVEPQISDLVRRYTERRVLRGRLAATWRAIENALEAERQRVEDVSRARDADRKALADEAERLREEQAAAVNEGNRFSEEAGLLTAARSELEALRNEAKGFIPEFQAAEREQLQQQYDGFASRLQATTEADGSKVERQLEDVRRRLREDTRLVERFGDAVVTWLRSHSGLDDGALADVFSLLDASLLGEVLGEGRVSVLEGDEAVALLRTLAQGFDADGFKGPGVRVRRPPGTQPSALAGYANVEVVKARIAEAQADEARLLQALEDIRERARLQAQRDEAGARLRAAHDRLRAWEAWTGRASEFEDLNVKLDDIRRRTSENTQKVAEVGARLTENALANSERERRAREVREVLERQKSDVNGLNPAPVGWEPVTEPGDLEGVNLDGLVRVYAAGWSEHTGLSKRVDGLLAEVKHKTAERVLGATDDETIDRLKDELAALDDRDRSVRDLWSSLVDDMRNAFKALIDGVEEIRKEVSRLTSALDRRQVSNLERIELELVRQRELIQRLHSVVQAEEMPLFVGPHGRSRAALDVQTWLEDRPRLDLAELFDLRFKVVDARGQVKSFDSLSQIESQGTSTTIKVLVHLELLRTMLADDGVSVPFFLDEVATLDAPNLRALIKHATSMGFVPVVASPEARDCVETLYFMRPSKGRLVLDETSRVRLHREPADAT
jgi:hypothetical protein